MNCTSCSAKTNPGDLFCKVCGAKINFDQNTQQQSVQQPSYNQPQQPNYNQPQQQSVQQPSYNQPQQPNVQQPSYNQPQQPNVQQQGYNQPRMVNGVPQVFNQPQQQYSEDDEMLDAFIGPNAYQLKNGGFSINTFLFGSLYTLYRKMWLLSLIWIVGSIILANFLPDLAGILNLAATIYMSIEFKKLYVKNAREEIAKIKFLNPNLSKEQLMLVLRQKGGTSIWPVVVSAVLILITIVLIVVPVIFASLNSL